MFIRFNKGYEAFYALEIRFQRVFSVFMRPEELEVGFMVRLYQVLYRDSIGLCHIGLNTFRRVAGSIMGTGIYMQDRGR